MNGKSNVRYPHVPARTHTHNGASFSHNGKKEILPFAMTWMDLEGITLSEVSQTKTNTE